MNFAELRGSVIVRLAPRDRVPVAGVEIELFNAVDDVITVARKLRSEALDRVAYVDASAGIDIYDYPEEAEEIRDIFFLNFGQTPIPMTAIAFRETPIVDWVGLAGSIMPFTWVRLPGRQFRIMNKPLQAAENAFMVRFLPRPKHMVKDADEPNLPRSVHECIVPGAIIRMASYDGIGLSHPGSFNVYKNLMQERLEIWLQQPIDDSNHVLDIDPNYPGGA